LVSTSADEPQACNLKLQAMPGTVHVHMGSLQWLALTSVPANILIADEMV